MECVELAPAVACRGRSKAGASSAHSIRFARNGYFGVPQADWILEFPLEFEVWTLMLPLIAPWRLSWSRVSVLGRLPAFSGLPVYRTGLCLCPPQGPLLPCRSSNKKKVGITHCP